MPCLDKETLNVLRVSLSMMILFTAVLSQEFIQEPLIGSLADAGIGGIRSHDGYLSLCLIYLFNTLSCGFAPFLVTRITGKWSMCLGIITMLFFQGSFLIPTRALLLTVSSFTGIGATFFWVGQGQYITENVSEKNMEKNTAFQWAFFKMSLVYGGVFFFWFFQNQTIQDAVNDGKIPLFICVFVTCTLISLLNIAFLPQSKMSQHRKKQAFFQTTVDCLKLMKTRRMLCLALFFFYTGFVRSFWISIYPSCIKFTSSLAANTSSLLSLGMIVTGFGQVIGSVFVTIIGRNARKVGKHLLVIFALLLHISLFVVISMCFPNDAPLGHTDKVGPVFKANVYVAMTISGFLGFGDAILQTQVYAYIAEYYQKESSSLFSIFRFFSGIASTIMFFSAQYFTLVCHLSILITTALIAGFAILTIRKMAKKQEKNSTLVVAVFQIRTPHGSP